MPDDGCGAKNPMDFVTLDADFDGDHRQDRAQLMIRERPAALGLWVCLAAATKATLLEVYEGKGWDSPDVFGIERAQPGTYRTLCARDPTGCDPGEEPTITLQYPAIDFFKCGSANSYFYWDKRTGSFRQAWMSD